MLFLLLFQFYFLSLPPPIIAVNRNVMTLYDPSGFVGGRAGNPQCDDILGRPHKSSCECAVRAMEWTRITARRRRTTTYQTASAIFTADLLSDETPSQPLRGERPFRWPRLALPRQYTCGDCFFEHRKDDCAISIRFTDNNIETFDEADVNAIRQTALAITNTCVLTQYVTPTAIRTDEGGEARGGWQIAGVNRKILVSVHEIPFDRPEGHRFGHRDGWAQGVCIEPTIEEPTYMGLLGLNENEAQNNGIGEVGPSGWDGFYDRYCKTGIGHRCCCPGLKYLISTETTGNNLVWDILWGVTQDVTRLLGKVAVCIAGVLSEDLDDSSP